MKYSSDDETHDFLGVLFLPGVSTPDIHVLDGLRYRAEHAIVVRVSIAQGEKVSSCKPLKDRCFMADRCFQMCCPHSSADVSKKRKERTRSGRPGS